MKIEALWIILSGAGGILLGMILERQRRGRSPSPVAVPPPGPESSNVGEGLSSRSSTTHPQQSALQPPLEAPSDASPVSLPSNTLGSVEPLDNAPWVDLATQCAELFDELDRTLDQFDPARREVAEHALYRLREVLELSGVDVIDGDPVFDRNRHEPMGPVPTGATDKGTMRIVSPGFAVGRRVLRRARVSFSPAA